MVVSFACHVLHLNRRLIHPHLAGMFRDYDPGIHLPQLQMQAGVVGWNAIRIVGLRRSGFQSCGMSLLKKSFSEVFY